MAPKWLSVKRSPATPTDSPDASQYPVLTGNAVPHDQQSDKDNGKDSEKSPIPSDSSPPPDGGYAAWMQVAAVFSIFFNTWGILNTFGIFQTYYEAGTMFQKSSSDISWIGSIQAYFVLAIGLFSGPIYDRGHYRALLLSGSFLIVFGFMMLSICKTFWQVLIAQGFCIGIGAGLVFVPSLAILPMYFNNKLGMAVGIAASGSSLGGVIYPIIFYRLVDRIGFGWTVRTLGFIALAMLLIPVCFAKMRFKPRSTRDVLDWGSFTDLPFALFVVSNLIGYVGLYMLLFYISYFAIAGHITTPEMSFYLVPILNAASVFGRTIPNAISDKVGPFNLFGPAAVICGILSFSLIGVNSLVGITIIAVLLGFFSGVFIALPSVCFVRLTKDKSKLGTRIGMGFAFMAAGILAGGPGGGNVVGSNEADLHWHSLWICAGCTLMVSGVLLIVLRFWLARGKMIVKV